MKKFLSILLALALLFSLGITAFAATTEPTGTITVTNATQDREYNAYKIFGATISTDKNGKTAVSYIADGSKYFDKIFKDATYTNDYFVYNSNTGTITKKEGVNDADLIDYLTKLVKDSGFAADKTKTATDDEVVFDSMPYGYYLITSSLGSTVTINSNTPDVSVIDKNQKPGNGFDKLIATATDDAGNPTTWGDSNTANIGDKITYKVAFEATNYDGDKKIQYYQIHDEKGDAIWVEFDSFKVVVDGVELPRGYYLDPGDQNNGDWEFLNEGSTLADSWNNIPAAQKNRNNAQWYLVHLGEDEFRITIPWLENHTLEDVTNANDELVSYSLKFADTAASKFASPASVVVTYDAVVEANAAIGNTTHGNRYNKAYASWTSTHETGYTNPEEVVTYVYGLGLLKDDIATGVNLAGAEFRVYKDKACTTPVFLLPTDIDGIYIVDSLNTPLASASGTGKLTTRDFYAAYRGDYLTNSEGVPVAQNNLVVSQKNGKLVILGLEAGTYYLQEVKAPSGYNALAQPVELKAGEDIRPFSIFADKDGHVADIQQADGIHTEKLYSLTHTVVHNSQGVVLPSTGGMGTFWLITIGSLLAIVFAVFLITHKKMSVYAD